MLQGLQPGGDQRGFSDPRRAADRHESGEVIAADPIEGVNKIRRLRMGGVKGVGKIKRGGAILQARGKSGNVPVATQGGLAAAQVGDQAVNGLVAVLRFFCQQLEDDGRQHGGHTGAHHAGGARLGGDMVVRPFALILASRFKRQAASEQFVKHNAQAVEIAAAVHRALGAGGVFRRHIGRRAADDRQPRLL